MDDPAVTAPATQRLEPPQHSDGGNSSLEAGTDPAAERYEVPIGKESNLVISKNDRGWRRIVRNFSPSWFSVTMGTGVVAAILYSIPWEASWLYYLSIIFFAMNVMLFSAAFIISCLRYAIWPEIWTVMIEDSTNSLFLGTIPMGFATLVGMWISVCVPAWGTWAVYFGWAIWMLDSIVAIAVTLSLKILLMSASHQRSLDTITAVQLLPIAATIVAAAVGSRVAEVLPNPQHALGTIIACYVMWGMAVPMAFTVLVIYYQRLALHKMPPREVIVSAFLPLGPLGYGGYTMLYLGKVAAQVFPETGSIDPMAGKFAYIAGFYVALIMWAWGMVWFALALASIYKAWPLPFNMGWWGFTFPLGVYSLSTVLIGVELPSLFFRVLGTIFGVAVILLWCVIAFRTVMGAWNGHLFNAPCLANLKRDEDISPSENGTEDKVELGAVRSVQSVESRRRAPAD
ncbi:Plasma membrane sulfite pump involved in sulfite metabolism [Vermiconidia calcicola]|uniref:Plasma membrane sulfite pump involved in sulfite metabolism n=1 Tax=Vermiconidia calcicola TaxID=1690605 RepID=A0ACC3ML68_9PEZI|nr:Plasma membrane sulfite pump involved in sulfite metabolism [Vermiconidia calcicola]